MSQTVDSYSRAEAEKYIKDSSSAWAESVASNDASVVKRILADDFVWVREGKVLDKSGAVTVAQQGPGDLVSNHLDYANVRFFGDTAVVQGSETWTRKGGVAGHFVFIDTWVRRGGIWQIVAAVDVSVPAAIK
jgi:ketosteroid isomerase-like protein